MKRFSKMNKPLEVVTWCEVRARVKKVNAQLADLIDRFKPTDDYLFVLARYSFGQLMIANGKLQVPVLGGMDALPIDSSTVCTKIAGLLDYNSIPLTLILNKKSEIYYESQDRVMPTKVLEKGSLFGLWEHFDPPLPVLVKSIWNVSAGVRSTFMLNKVSDKVAHKRLQKSIGIKGYAPNSLLSQHKIFKEMVCLNEGNDWSMEVLYFSKQWVKIAENASYESLAISNYFLEQAWKQSYNCRNNMAFDLARDIFAIAVTNKNIKPKPLILNTLKHLLTMLDGFYPGYAPAMNDEGLPRDFICMAYKNYYMLNPTIIMEPKHLCGINDPIYYSLQLPTLLENAPGSIGKNIIDGLRDLSVLIDILTQQYPDLFNHFKVFHSEEDASYGIFSIEELAKEDQNISQLITSIDRSRLKSSPFFKGGIQLSLSSNRQLPLPLSG